MVSEALAENNYAVNRLLCARDLAELSKGRLWDHFEREIRSEPSHGIFWEKAGNHKTPYSQTGSFIEVSGPVPSRTTYNQENKG